MATREDRRVVADWLVVDVLVVEDDPRSAALMESILEGICRRVVVANTAAAALDMLAESVFDLITLDIGLPDLSGLELIHHIRAVTDAPMIMVTATGQSSAIVEALERGADDYLVKPIRPAELRARIHAVTRRAQPRTRDVVQYSDHHVQIDFARSVVVTASGTSMLTATERRLLRELVANSGRVLTHDEIIRRVWGSGYEGTLANLHVFVSHLRRKLNNESDLHQYIGTHRGIGYEFVPPADEHSV